MKKPNFYRQIIIYPFVLMPIFIWIGFVCSISFMEAWLKFRAPNVSLATGLSIGRLIFAALNKAEWFLAGITAALILLGNHKLKLKKWIFFYISFAILLLQTFFLLPSLYERVEIILQDMIAQPSFVHFYYIFFEVMKVLSLLILGINIIYDLNKTDIEQIGAGQPKIQ